ncbi:hypothetical protein XaC1_340 [Xanthomonas phage XaC1]|nr:hypothetical protein XaC1_340 [Xanthomonas phage XaC1]
MIPCSGTIKASDINVELQRSGNAVFDINNTPERQLAGKPSGLIKFSDFACKSYGFKLTVGQANGNGATTTGYYNSDGGYGKTGLINGARPAQYFNAGFMGSTQGFYIHDFFVAGVRGNTFFQAIFDASNSGGYPTNAILPFGRNPTLIVRTTAGAQATAKCYYYRTSIDSIRCDDASIINMFLGNIGGDLFCTLQYGA